MSLGKGLISILSAVLSVSPWWSPKNCPTDFNVIDAAEKVLFCHWETFKHVIFSMSHDKRSKRCYLRKPWKSESIKRLSNIRIERQRSRIPIRAPIPIILNSILMFPSSCKTLSRCLCKTHLSLSISSKRNHSISKL